MKGSEVTVFKQWIMKVPNWPEPTIADSTEEQHEQNDSDETYHCSTHDLWYPTCIYISMPEKDIYLQ